MPAIMHSRRLDRGAKFKTFGCENNAKNRICTASDQNKLTESFAVNVGMCLLHNREWRKLQHVASNLI